MPSYSRKFILSDQCYFHITWQCHNGSWLLKKPWAKQLYYDLLLKFKDEYDVQIHGYNFMDSHPHLMGYGETQVGVSKFMKRVNGIFARTYNRKTKRKGQVIMDRFSSTQIETDRHLLTEMVYLDLNPVRARMVSHPENYLWSSYAYYAHGIDDPLLTPAPSYLGLATTTVARQELYRQLISDLIEKELEERPSGRVYFIGSPEWVTARKRELKERFRSYLKELQRKRGPTLDQS